MVGAKCGFCKSIKTPQGKLLLQILGMESVTASDSDLRRSLVQPPNQTNSQH